MEKRVAPPLQQVLATSASKKSSQAPNLDKADVAVRSRNSSSGISKKPASGSAGASFSENDTFNKHYNKELRVSKDEIPIVLSELNDSAIQFIKREQYEKALNLLQKAYGIMDVVDFQLCRRDKLNLFVLFHNMSLCYQKLQMLEECAQCIEQALEYMPADQFSLEERSVSNRMRKLQLVCKLKLQYCAILSQIHRHKDALDQSKEGVRISHHLINDLRQLCEFYIKREDIEQSYTQPAQQPNPNSRNNNHVSGQSETEQMYSSYRSQRKEKKLQGGSRNRSFCQFLSQQEDGGIFQQSSVTSQLKHTNFPPQRANLIDNASHNLSSFYSLNFLEESMSYLERTARKLHPILLEIKKRMVPEKTLKEKLRRISQSGIPGQKNKIETLDSVHEDMVESNDSQDKKIQADMKNILGYLNQGEWTQTLSIGSIMQLQPFSLKDLLEQGKNELELTRESFIQKVSMLAVSYFCYSTEIRFILQMKEDPSYDLNSKQKESEFWHAKSLELACSFLPSECPLLNHINLSYQKHFAPVKQTIMEEEAVQDDLKVVKPLTGIDNPKFQPIIRSLGNIQIAITPYQMTPLNQVTQPFLSQMVSFNEYQEYTNPSMKQNSIGNNNLSQQNIRQNRSGDLQPNVLHKRGATDIIIPNRNQLEKYLQPPNQSVNNTQDTEDELEKFERLFEKLIKENKIDKLDLLKKLQFKRGDSQNSNEGAIKNVLEERESILSNDLLLDEQIMNEDDSQQIIDDEEHNALEAQHLTASNNLYKFRNPEAERPKTSNGTSHNREDKLSQLEKINQYHKHVEEKKRSSNRPLSGGLHQKLKSEQQKSRVQKMQGNPHNMSMYEKFGGLGGSPDRQFTANIGPKAMGQNSSSQFLTSNQPPQPNQSAGLSSSQQQKAKLNYLVHHQHVQSQAVIQQQQQPAVLTATKINASAPVDAKKTETGNLQAYDELKKRLLSEYKKLTSGKKTFDDQVREKYKNLKQRAVSGKKSQSQHQVPNLQPTQSATGQLAQGNAGYNPVAAQQLSPRHHLNVYKPTFIINNSFAGENGPPNGSAPQMKEQEILDEAAKRYRPSSKQAQPQPSAFSSQQQQQLLSQGARSQSIGSNLGNPQAQQPIPVQSYINERSFQNVPAPAQQLINNPQLLGMFLNNEKKTAQHTSQSQLSGPHAIAQKKTSIKAHHQQQHSQPTVPTEVSYMKSYINSQQPNVPNTSQILSQQTKANYSAQAKPQSGYSTQQQFNQFNQLQQQQQMAVQQYPLSSQGAYKASLEHKNSTHSQRTGSQGPQHKVAQQQFDKIKKKVNNY